MTIFLPRNTKEDVQNYVHAALFYTIKMNGDQQKNTKVSQKSIKVVSCKSSEVIQLKFKLLTQISSS